MSEERKAAERLVVKGIAAATVATAFLFLFFRQDFRLLLERRRFFAAD